MIEVGKDMGIRYAGSQDALCLFNRELLASPAPESEQELLELVKKAKCDADKYHPPAPMAGSGQQSGSGSEGGTSNLTTVNSGSIGHAQACLMNVIRSGPAYR
ncbi:unnamed protein product [Sphagnum balticum]